MTTLRCPECRAALRVNMHRVGSRTTAPCPKCHGPVPLSSEAGPTQRLEVVCEGCGARLRASADKIGRKSRCPRCHGEVVIRQTPPVAAAGTPSPSAGSVGAETQRIDSRVFGLEGSGTPSAAPPPAGVDLQDFIVQRSPEEGPGGTDTPSRGTGAPASLLRPPVGAMSEAAEEIRDAAARIAEPPAETPLPPSSTEVPASAPDKPQMTERPDRKKQETKSKKTRTVPDRKPRPAPVRGAPARRTTQDTGTSAGFGMICGALAGAIIGTIWLTASVFAGMQTVEMLLAPTPGWASGLGLPEPAVSVGLPTILGAFVGLFACMTTARRRRLGYLSGTLWGLLVGSVVGASWLFMSGFHPNLSSVSMALNWSRDLALTGLLTTSVVRLFSSSR